MKSLKLFSTLAVALVFSLFAAGCEEESNMAPDQDLENIVQRLASFDQEITYNIYKDNSGARPGKGLTKAAEVTKKPTFFTLRTALKEAGLFTTVAKNKLTVFAPTDDAFAALGINPDNVGEVPGLTEILLYHVVAGEVYSGDLSEGYVPTLNGAAVEISLDGGVFVNDSEVIKADVRALNGVIHVIDQVLMPPMETLWGIVEGNDTFSTLQLAIETAGLVETLDDPEANFTVFAPTNDAFGLLLGELGLTAEQLLALPNLDQVLLYHVLSGRVYSSDLSEGLSVEMANGENITFDLTGAPAITDVNGRSVPLNTGMLNIQANNGVAHVIDQVLLPTL